MELINDHYVQLCICDFMFQYSSVMLYLQILLTSSPLPLISELEHKLGNSCLLRAWWWEGEPSFHTLLLRKWIPTYKQAGRGGWGWQSKRCPGPLTRWMHPVRRNQYHAGGWRGFFVSYFYVFLNPTSLSSSWGSFIQKMHKHLSQTEG